MNQEKTGRLIAKLRKEKDMTQQDLGELVGVGSRAVSKWERGITSPDISIINSLSKILGISTDELLDGEMNKIKHETNNQNINKNSKKHKKHLIIIPIIIVIIILLIFLFKPKNKSYTYNMISKNEEEVSVIGEATFKDNEVSIFINNITFNDKEFANTIVKNYEYELFTNDVCIFSLGYLDSVDIIPTNITIKDFSKKFNINYIGKPDTKRRDLVKNGIVLKLIFTDENDEEIIKEIKIGLVIKNN